MDFELNEEQQSIRKTARDFCEREIVPFAREWDRTETMDRGIVAKLGELGFLGAPLPEEYGGMGVDNVSYCLIIEELGKADSSVRGVVSVNVGLVAKTILKWGTQDQKQQWLPSICSGETLACYGLTEPSSGSDAASLKTKAVRDGDDWILSGSKMFITNGTWARVALIFARTGGEGPKGISAFLVPTDSDGFTATKVTGKLGLRAQDTGELHMDGVRVPDANRIGAEGEGFKVAMSALDSGRMSLAAGSVGIAQGALEASVKYATEREQFSRPIARFQLVQELIADMAVEIDAARLLTWRVATLADRAEKHTLESSIAKYYAS
ncbi:MAG: acyl-CoA dehydrogenase family protein, partial [Actinomycetota bacterium]|nr:acyl-CoA dehydrogenase family protein [Actinomycetota bacterium]